MKLLTVKKYWFADLTLVCIIFDHTVHSSCLIGTMNYVAWGLKSWTYKRANKQETYFSTTCILQNA